MTSANHISRAPSLLFSFNTQHAGIIISAIIHAVIMLLLLLPPVIKIIPHRQTIQINLEQQDVSSADNSGGAAKITVSKVNRGQNNSVPKTSKAVPTQKEIFREQALSEKQSTIKTALPAEKPIVAANNNKEAVGSINVENQSDIKAKASIAPQTRNQGIVETKFGEIGAPAFVHREMPVYPMLARRLGKEGKVLLKLLIDINGKLQDVEVVESAGFGFTEAAVTAVKNSTYVPARRNGEKITVKALLPIRFNLQ